MRPSDYLLCGGVLLAGYTLNLLYITVFYHRGFTHRALELRPWLRTAVRHTGSWVTGLDVKAWVCMHRLHHALILLRAGDREHVGVAGVNFFRLGAHAARHDHLPATSRS